MGDVHDIGLAVVSEFTECLFDTLLVIVIRRSVSLDRSEGLLLVHIPVVERFEDFGHIVREVLPLLGRFRHGIFERKIVRVVVIRLRYGFRSRFWGRFRTLLCVEDQQTQFLVRVLALLCVGVDTEFVADSEKLLRGHLHQIAFSVHREFILCVVLRNFGPRCGGSRSGGSCGRLPRSLLERRSGFLNGFRVFLLRRCESSERYDRQEQSAVMFDCIDLAIGGVLRYKSSRRFDFSDYHSFVKLSCEKCFCEREQM